MLAGLPVFQDLAAASGMEPDVVVLIVFLYVPLFLAPVYRGLNSQPLRVAFDVVVGTLMLFGLYGVFGSSHFFGLCGVCLVLVYAVPNPLVVTVVAFGYLLVRHFATWMHPPTSLDVDITGPMMIVVLKLISMAFTFQDLAKTHSKPSAFVVVGYLLHHSSVVAGPVIRLHDYLHYTALDKSKTPSPLVPAAWKFVQSLLWLVVHVRFGVMSDFSAQDIADPAVALSFPFFQRAALQYWSVVLVRVKFYGAWMLGEASLNLAGWGHDEKAKNWDTLRNVRVTGVELSENPRMTVANWNISVSEWLREYVMARFSNRDTGTIAAFVVSGVWHGFAVNKFLFFLLVSVYVTVIARKARRAFRPLALTVAGGRLKPLYDVVGCVLSLAVFNFIAAAWMLDDLNGVWSTWHNLHYYGFVLCLLSYALSTLILASQKQDRRKEKKAD